MPFAERNAGGALCRLYRRSALAQDAARAESTAPIPE